MSLPDFELGPLEMQEVAASEPAIAPATARVRVDGEAFLFRICGGRFTYKAALFFRLDFSNSPIFLATTPRKPLDSSLFEKMCQLISHNDYDLLVGFKKCHLFLSDEELPLLLRELLQTDGFYRKMAFRSESLVKPMALQIHRGGAYWSRSLISGDRINFRFSCHTQDELSWLLNTSDEEVVHKVENCMKDEESDCSFSWRWTQANHEQKERLVARFKKGDFDEFGRILKWLTYSQFTSWSEQSVVEWMVLLECHAMTDEWSETREPHTYQNISRGSIKFSDSFDSCLDVVHRYFLPFYDEDMKRFSIIEHIASVSNFEIYIQVRHPTQHERLEAHFRLREWLADKVAPEEIPALLGES